MQAFVEQVGSSVSLPWGSAAPQVLPRLPCTPGSWPPHTVLTCCGPPAHPSQPAPPSCALRPCRRSSTPTSGRPMTQLLASRPTPSTPSRTPPTRGTWWAWRRAGGVYELGRAEGLHSGSTGIGWAGGFRKRLTLLPQSWPPLLPGCCRCLWTSSRASAAATATTCARRRLKWRTSTGGRVSCARAWTEVRRGRAEPLAVLPAPHPPTVAAVATSSSCCCSASPDMCSTAAAVSCMPSPAPPLRVATPTLPPAPAPPQCPSCRRRSTRARCPASTGSPRPSWRCWRTPWPRWSGWVGVAGGGAGARLHDAVLQAPAQFQQPKCLCLAVSCALVDEEQGQRGRLPRKGLVAAPRLLNLPRCDDPLAAGGGLAADDRWREGRQPERLHGGVHGLGEAAAGDPGAHDGAALPVLARERAVRRHPCTAAVLWGAARPAAPSSPAHTAHLLSAPGCRLPPCCRRPSGATCGRLRWERMPRRAATAAARASRQAAATAATRWAGAPRRPPWRLLRAGGLGHSG